MNFVKDNIIHTIRLDNQLQRKKKHFLTQKIKEKLHGPLSVECKKTE